MKKETLAQMFFCEFCEISTNTFFYRTPPVAASVLPGNRKQLASLSRDYADDATTDDDELFCSISVDKWSNSELISNRHHYWKFLPLQTPTFCELRLNMNWAYNHFHNILRLSDVLPNFPFTKSETMRDYYLSRRYIRVSEWRKTYIRKVSTHYRMIA